MTKKDRRNFREFYGVDNALDVGINSLLFHFTAKGAAISAMKKQTMNNGYCIHRIKNRDDITFGRPKLDQYFAIPPNSEDVLLLSAGKETSFEFRKPILALRYGIYADEFVIGYAQTPSEVTLEDYFTVRDDIGVRPHEFLFAHFIARVAPILNKYPAIGVYVAPHYLDKPVYPTLRDRFFDAHYILNPKRQRVQELLGEDNEWLEEDSLVLREKQDNVVRKTRDTGDHFGYFKFPWFELFV